MLRALALALLVAACAPPERLPEAAPETARRPAPASLQSRLEALAAPFEGKIGIAVRDVSAGWTAAVAGDQPFQQQSVFKTWVAAAVLDAADRGALRLDETIRLTPAHLVYPYRPIEKEIGPTGRDFTLEELIRWSVIHSDNAAVDALIDRVGGVEAVQTYLRRRNIAGIRVDMDERGLHNAAAEYRAAFNAAPASEQSAVLARVFGDLRNSATPVATADALARLHRGELLSPASTALLLKIMDDTVTGPDRLKAGAGPGWGVAHKTGGGGDLGGATLGSNDVGLLTNPDGRVYAVAVFIWGSKRSAADRDRVTADVARAVVAHAQS